MAKYNLTGAKTATDAAKAKAMQRAMNSGKPEDLRLASAMTMMQCPLDDPELERVRVRALDGSRIDMAEARLRVERHVKGFAMGNSIVSDFDEAVCIVWQANGLNVD